MAVDLADMAVVLVVYMVVVADDAAEAPVVYRAVDDAAEVVAGAAVALAGDSDRVDLEAGGDLVVPVDEFDPVVLGVALAVVPVVDHQVGHMYQQIQP